MRLYLFLLSTLIIHLVTVNCNISVNFSTENTSETINNIPRGSFTNNFTEYELVHPQKVSSKGEFLSSYLPHFHESTKNRKRREKEIESLHYHIPINGRRVQVELQPNENVFPPNMVIEHRSIHSDEDIGNIHLRTPEKRNCFYKGKLTHDPNSKVALSTCNGLAGYIRSQKEGEYLIEPIQDYDPHNEDHPHIIFRKKYDTSKSKNGNCGVKVKHKTVKQKEILKTQNSLFNKQLLQPFSSKSKDKRIEMSSNAEHDENKDNSSAANEKSDDYSYLNSDSEYSTESEREIKIVSHNRGETKGSIKCKGKGCTNGKHYDEVIKNNKMYREYTNTSMSNQEIPLADCKPSPDKCNKNNNNASKPPDDKKEKVKKAQRKKIDKKKCFSNKNRSKGKNELNTEDKELYKSKDTSKSDNLDSSLIHGKKFLSKNMIDHYSDWDHVVKSMLQKDKIENLKSNNQNLNTDYLDSSLKHHHKGNTKQKIKSVPEQEDEETNISSKIKKDLRKNMIIDYNVNNPTNQNLNVHKNYNSYNNAKKREVILSNETDSSGKSLYKSRIIRSLYVSNDVQVNNTNGETKFKRAIAVQYKSCKPVPCCANRSECTHDLRLLVVISYIFSQNHKDIDLETYVLTLLNMISINFHDATLGILVNIKLVRMVFIEYKMEELDEEKNSFEQLFENFCVFQYRINPHRVDHPNRHDIAIYIINVNQCGGNRFIGITNKESVCHSKDTCILSVDDGLLLANIITHQLGHSLGAEHDDGGQGSCQPFEPDGSVYYFMGPQITQNATEWSVCSSQAIIRFIRNQGDRCLKYFAIELDFEFPSILPGQIYSPTQQCSLNFRMKTLPCYTGDFCKFLYCQATKYECVSRLVPPADGTLCATGMWCIRGNCVSKGRYPGAVNGEWSNWSEWTMCSRSCGGGIQHAKRMCNNPPPALGGRYCVGERMRHQMCNYHTRCDRFSGSYHDYQCTKTEFMPFRGQFYTWRSYHNSFENVACNLICESNTGIIAVRELIVHDGTPCKPGTKNVCVQGKCTEIGCDWGVNSRAYRDACGNCKGNGTECRIIQGIFEEKNGKGTVPFLKIPKGSGMIYAREINPSDAVLLVSGYNGDTYYLNGPAQLLEPKPAEYNFGGNTRGVYSMRGNMERIYIPGPLEEDLIFHVKLHSDPNPGVRYQFAIPEVDKNYIPSYTWMFLDWEYCSDACGGGQQRASAKCVEDQGGRVDDKYCLERERPDDVIRSCNEFPCIPKWWVGAWSDCVPIGNEEIRYRSVLCMRTRDAISLRNEILKDKFCCEEEKPDSIRRCNETVDDKPLQVCDYSRGCQGPPSIYNIQDLDPTFSDLIDSKIREANLEEIARNYFKDSLSENDEEDPYDLDVDLSALNDLGGTRKIINADIKRETKNRTKETRIFRNESRPNSNLVKDDINPEVDENTKRKHNKKSYSKMYLQQNILSHERKTVSKNGTDKYKKLSALGGGSAYANQGSGRHRVNLQHKNLLIRTNIDKPQILTNNYNKFGGTSCPCSQCPTTLPPPLCIPPETTCTTRCTTCPPMLRFTIPNSNYLVFRPACPVIDQIVLSDFKISVIPIICDQGYDMQNDFYFQVYHETGSWPFGLENNRTIIRGQRALFYLLEIRNNVTKAPFIYHGEN